MADDLDAAKFVAYDPETGALTWLKRDGADAKTRAWNTRFGGMPALASVDPSTGYKRGSLLGRKAFAHRVAFAIYHGRWPKKDIDHINGDRLDNRISNLREVERVVNARNRGFDVRCSSGVVGVHRRGDRWIARIGRGLGVNSYIGIFATKEEAAAARRKHESILGYRHAPKEVGHG